MWGTLALKTRSLLSSVDLKILSYPIRSMRLRAIFSNGNHTATQSTLEAPCTALQGGVHNCHTPFQDGQTEVGTFDMPVISKEPTVILCTTGPHCREGQVMVINPASPLQVIDFVKNVQATTKSVDGTNVIGGIAGNITLDAAA